MQEAVRLAPYVSVTFVFFCWSSWFLFLCNLGVFSYVAHRSGIHWLILLVCGGCAAHGNALPPFPDEWPLEGVDVVHPADVPSEHLPPATPFGDGCGTPGAYAELPCEMPGGPLSPAAPLLPNPLAVPVVDRDAAWESIVDIVDDYFRIAREERVQLIEQVLTEGRIETYPQMGATILEPHRPDSVGHFNRSLATYQTIRRIALVRVVPADGGFEIGVIVETQMEDLPHPEHATAGQATLRSDTSLSEENADDQRRQREGVWFPIGRDVALEQQILAEIRACLDVAPPGVVY